MSKPRYPYVAAGVLLITAGISGVGFAPPADSAPGTLQSEDEEARDRAVMERFLSVLEKAPRRGTGPGAWLPRRTGNDRQTRR